MTTQLGAADPDSLPPAALLEASLGWLPLVQALA